MTGKLFAVGIGPGDPELVTLKARRILTEVSCFAVPRGQEEGESLALQIAKKVIPLADKEILELHFPMMKTRPESGRGNIPVKLTAKWREAAAMVAARLKEGRCVAFLTLGCPTLYSTFFYLLPCLREMLPEAAIEIVPGVSAVNAAAARAGIPLGLGNEGIAILPANYPQKLPEVLHLFDSTVLMKVAPALPAVRETLKEAGWMGRIHYASRVGLPGEEVREDLPELPSGKGDYFSLLILTKNERSEDTGKDLPRKTV
jgi:precorrin-2/cobalt-factor-2 C20-methyltransferase